MGQENVTEFGTALQGEDPLRRLISEWRDHLKDPTVEMIISSLRTLLPDVDQAVLTDEFGEDMVANFHEALRTGVDGWVDDDLAFTRSWGFDIKEILGPDGDLARFGRPHGAVCARRVVLERTSRAQRSTSNKERAIFRSGSGHSTRCWTSSSAPANRSGRPFTEPARAPSALSELQLMPVRLR